MKDIDIHNGLPEQELRDFFSQELVKSWVSEIHNKKATPIFQNEDPIKWAIEDAEAHAEYHQKRVEILKNRHAIVRLIKERGWQEFDVSDHVLNLYAVEMKMNFIGTETEYNNLIKKLEND